MPGRPRNTFPPDDQRESRPTGIRARFASRTGPNRLLPDACFATNALAGAQTTS